MSTFSKSSCIRPILIVHVDMYNDCNISRGKPCMLLSRCLYCQICVRLTLINIHLVHNRLTSWPYDTNRASASRHGLGIIPDGIGVEYLTPISMQISAWRVVEIPTRVFQPWPSPRITRTRYATREFRTLGTLEYIVQNIIIRRRK